MKTSGYLLGMLLGLVFLTVATQAQTVKINELYSRGVAGDLDWIEVYNPSSSPVDISGYKIYDNGGQAGSKPKKEFPAGTVLPAKGFYAIVTDTASFPGDGSGFGLSSGGETVWLENATGTLIDTVVLPALGVDTSWARVPDGSGMWVKLAPRTKGVSNVMIKMNEIYSRGVAGALDWIEIHNASSGSIDISGYKIYDNGGQAGSKPKKEFPAGTILPANGFYVIITDTASFTGDGSGFGLSSGGETVWLENTTGLVIDTVAIPALGVDTSYARVPDGSNVMTKLSPYTRGTTNGGATSVTDEPTIVEGYALHQNYPNPFNPATTISFTLPTRSLVSVKVYDLLGKEIAELVNGEKDRGMHVVNFDARNLSSGIYIVSLKAGNYVGMMKMALLK